MKLDIFRVLFALLLLQYVEAEGLGFNTLNYTTSFDRYSGSVPAPVNRLQALVWSDFKYTRPYVDVNKITYGILPRSTPNYAAIGSGIGGSGGLPVVTANYNNSTILYFDLYHFYFGCTDRYAPNRKNKPIPCTITLGGFQVGVRGEFPSVGASFSYQPKFAQPSNQSSAPMQLAVLPETFRFLEQVIITYLDDTPPTIYIDQAKYRIVNYTIIN